VEYLLKSREKKMKNMTLLKLRQVPGTQVFPGFNNIFDLFDNSIHAGFRTWNTPAVNIANTQDGFELQVAAPGLKKENFKVNIEGDQLTISAEVKEESTDSNPKFSHREFRFTNFKRSFTLPENANKEAVNASYKDGVLTLAIPVKEEEKAKSKEVTIL
jgi:HSP20 family protein